MVAVGWGWGMGDCCICWYISVGMGVLYTVAHIVGDEESVVYVDIYKEGWAEFYIC